MFAIMDEEPEPEDGPDAVRLTDCRGNVRLEDVTFGYNPDKIILKHISLYANRDRKLPLWAPQGPAKPQ